MKSRLAALNDQFQHVVKAPVDPIFSLTVAYNADKDPRKINLGAGVYRDDNGKPHVFDVVRKAEAKIVADHTLNKDYAAIDGLPEFTKACRGLLFGQDHPDVTSGRVASAQTLSGTGALRVLFEFLAKFRSVPVYISDRTWPIHHQVCKAAGVPVHEYRYYDAKTRALNFDGMVQDLSNAQPGSIVMLHTCAHNPTGVDPSQEQWRKIAEVVEKRNLFPFFDTAYQGFATGSLENDAYAIRYFLDQGFQMVIAQSFAKIMGLYGERTGACHVVCKDKAAALRVSSQLKGLIRANYSNPPKHGALVATMVLNNPEMRKAWMTELIGLCDSIKNRRKVLRDALEKINTPGTWNHMTDQIGMFTFTGLNAKQSKAMIDKHHIYMTANGRISICGYKVSQVDYIAAAIKDVVENY